MGEVPLLGERVDAEELSETREGAPSADICEKAEGDGRGVSINRCALYGGPLEGTRIG